MTQSNQSDSFRPGSIRYEIRVEGDLAGRTVRSILQHKLQLSRRMLRQLMTTDGVLRNGESVYQTARVNEGDIIYVMLPSEQSEIAPEELSIDVRYEDGECIVVNKDAGVLTHPTARERSGSLLAGVYHTIKPQIPHCVHRLDRDTSGLVMFARHGHFHHLFDTTLRQGNIHRAYVALVAMNEDDIPQDEWQTIDLPIAGDPRSPSRRIISAQGQRAITHYRLLAARPGAALVFVVLETGRTHQIRLHFSALGQPLLGDAAYGAKRQPNSFPTGEAGLEGSQPGCESKMRRQALHGTHLWFIHPVTGKTINVHAGVPEDMQQLWRAFGGCDDDWPNSQVSERLLENCPIFANIGDAKRS